MSLLKNIRDDDVAFNQSVSCHVIEPLSRDDTSSNATIDVYFRLCTAASDRSEMFGVNLLINLGRSHASLHPVDTATLGPLSLCARYHTLRYFELQLRKKTETRILTSITRDPVTSDTRCGACTEENSHQFLTR